MFRVVAALPRELEHKRLGHCWVVWVHVIEKRSLCSVKVIRVGVRVFPGWTRKNFSIYRVGRRMQARTRASFFYHWREAYLKSVRRFDQKAEGIRLWNVLFKR